MQKAVILSLCLCAATVNAQFINNDNFFGNSGGIGFNNPGLGNSGGLLSTLGGGSALGGGLSSLIRAVLTGGSDTLGIGGNTGFNRGPFNTGFGGNIFNNGFGSTNVFGTNGFGGINGIGGINGFGGINGIAGDEQVITETSPDGTQRVTRM